jgi:hypothetical protein
MIILFIFFILLIYQFIFFVMLIFEYIDQLQFHISLTLIFLLNYLSNFSFFFNMCLLFIDIYLLNFIYVFNLILSYFIIASFVLLAYLFSFTAHQLPIYFSRINFLFFMIIYSIMKRFIYICLTKL